MPLYEYKCGSCGKTFEVIQKFADEPLKIHPECGGEVIRLLSAPAFHLKGTGWYATDYAKKSNGSDSKSNEAKSDTKSESTTEMKTGTKTEKTDSKPSSDTKSASSSESKPSTAA